MRRGHSKGMVHGRAQTPEDTARTERAFALLIACTNWPLDVTRKARIVAAYELLDGDFQALLIQVQRHQVPMIVARGLAAAGCVVPEALAQIASAGARHAMRQAGEGLRLVAHLEAHGIDAIVIKGAPLSQLLYGDLTMRQCSDIDLMVAWDQFEQAIIVLGDCGYDLARRVPPFGDWRIEEWRKLRKDVTLVHPEKQSTLELHHRLIGQPKLLCELSIDHAVRPVKVVGISLRMFGDADLFVYLCVHAVTSPCTRLKWLTDLRVMLAGTDPDTIAGWQVHSTSLGTGRCTALGLMLVSQIWGQELPESVSEVTRQDRHLTSLLAASLQYLRGEELEEGSLSSSILYLSKIQLYDDPSHRGSFVAAYLRSAELLERFALPRFLRWLYVPLRFGLYAQRRAVRLISDGFCQTKCTS